MLARAKEVAADEAVVAAVVVTGPPKVVAPREICLEIGKKPRSKLS